MKRPFAAPLPALTQAVLLSLDRALSHVRQAPSNFKVTGLSLRSKAQATDTAAAPFACVKYLTRHTIRGNAYIPVSFQNMNGL